MWLLHFHLCDRPFSFASTQSNLNEAEMNNTSVCILSCTSDSVEAKPGDFIESDDRSAETNVYPTMNYSPSDYIRSLSEATVSENMTPKVIERTPQPIIITSNPKRKRHILSECKTSYPALDFGQVANYKLPRFPAWQAKYLHHRKLFCGQYLSMFF